MGYVPLPEAEARRIRRHLLYPGTGAAALDPCVGEGRALELITDGANCHGYGIELDAHRAAEARMRIGTLIYGDCFDVECRAESVSLLYLNPPYDTAAREEGPSERLEVLFLQHTYRWLKPGGILILVIPVAQLAVCGNRLSVQFRNTEVYRLSEPDSVRYKQIVLFGVRRTRRERERLSEWEITQARIEYGRKARDYESLPILTDQPGHLYSAPEAEPVEMIHRGLPLDVIEDLLQKSVAYRQARRILLAPEIREVGRPLTPLHQGHVALLATSGRLDGIFGQDDLRHIARWQGVKTILRVEEESDDGVTTIREKEQFSHCLNLLFVDGRTSVLTGDELVEEDQAKGATATPKEDSPASCTNVKCRIKET
ncbi:MAG: class I SAM-dependent methyltransferase [Acidobacteriota bacterium]|nr:class I SAM-dependent methyltransferase [Acidobacteriota bacterium]